MNNGASLPAAVSGPRRRLIDDQGFTKPNADAAGTPTDETSQMDTNESTDTAKWVADVKKHTRPRSNSVSFIEKSRQFARDITEAQSEIASLKLQLAASTAEMTRQQEAAQNHFNLAEYNHKLVGQTQEAAKREVEAARKAEATRQEELKKSQEEIEHLKRNMLQQQQEQKRHQAAEKQRQEAEQQRQAAEQQRQRQLEESEKQIQQQEQNLNALKQQMKQLKGQSPSKSSLKKSSANGITQDLGLPSMTAANDPKPRSKSTKGPSPKGKINQEHPVNADLQQRQTAEPPSFSASSIDLTRDDDDFQALPAPAAPKSQGGLTTSYGMLSHALPALGAPRGQDIYPAPYYAAPVNAYESQGSAEFRVRMQDLAHRKMTDARPQIPFKSGNSMEFSMHMALFDAATKSEFISNGDKLQELLHWFEGEPKKIVANHYMSQDKEMALALAKSELESIYKESQDSFDAAIAQITKGKQLHKNDYNGHISLYAQLREAQMVVGASTCSSEFNRRDVIRNILNSRIAHLKQRFWREDQKCHRASGRFFNFNDLLIELNAWIAILRAQGDVYVEDNEKKPQQQQQQQKNSANVANTRVQQQQAPQGRKNGYASSISGSPPRQQQQLSDFCPFCRGRHEVSACQELGKKSVDERVKMVAEKRLCFHCFQANHIARNCTDKPSCGTCGGKHATLMHGRKFEDPRATRSNLSANSMPFRPFTAPNGQNSAPPTAASAEEGAEGGAAAPETML